MANSPNVWGTASYTYDAIDNIKTSQVGGRSATYTYGPNNNRLKTFQVQGGATTNYSYNLQGNAVTRGTQNFVFDLGKRMRQTDGLAYRYDGYGRRTVINRPTTWAINIYSQAGKLMYGAELTPQTSSSSDYIYIGDKLITEFKDGGTTEYLHTDALGSPVARTSANAQTVTSRTQYEPYGATAGGTNPTGPGFTGDVNDQNGLVYMQQRYYDPVAGRFLSVDQVTPDAKTGSNFNRYAYAHDSPYKFIDPDGRDAVITTQRNGNVNIVIPIQFSGPRRDYQQC